VAWPGGKAWFDGVDIALEFSPTTDWKTAATWVDITANLQSISYTYGRTSSVLAQPSAGKMRATLVDNLRVFDPSYASSPYTGGGLTPRKQVRLRARYATVEYTLGTWYVNGWKQIPEPSNGLTLVELTATDGFDILSRAQVPISAGVFEGGGERVGARIGRLLDFASWPAAQRNLDTDSPAVGTLDRNSTYGVLSEIQTTAASDFGIFFMAANGDATYRGHRWSLANNLTPAATLGDTAGEVGYSDAQRDYADDQIVNHVKGAAYTPLLPTFYGDPNSSPYVLESVEVSDATSIASYGETVLDLGTVRILNSNVLQDTVEYALAFNAQPVVRAQQITLVPRRAAATMFPVVLGSHMGTRFTFNRRPNNVGSVASVDVIVEGGSVSLDFGGSMSVGYWVSQAAQASAGTNYWILGTSKLGSSGNAIWA